MAEEGKENLIGKTNSGIKNPSRRKFLKGIAQAGLILGTKFALGQAGGIIKLTEIGTGAAQAGLNALEQSQHHTTSAQKQAAEEFNKLEDEIRQNPKNLDLQLKRVYQLKTGPQGARLLSEPLTDKQTTLQDGQTLRADTGYNVQGGAIKVLHRNPFTTTGLPQIEWYFIATERDQQTRKVISGYFANAANFVSTSRGAVAQRR